MDEKTALIRQWMSDLLGGSEAAEIAATAIALVITIAFFWFLWWVLNRVLNRCRQYVTDNTSSLIKLLTIQRQRLFSPKETTRLLQGLVTGIGFLLKTVLILLFLNTSFAHFEGSRKVALNIFGFLGNIVGGMISSVINYIPNLIIVIIIVVLSRFIIRVTGLVFEGIQRERISLPGFYPEWSKTSFNLVRLLIIALTVIIVFPYLPGSDSPAFQGLSIFFGVLLSLGSSSAIANIISGIVITYTRAFQMGDRVKIAATEGDVVERSAFVTRIRTPKNVEVAIPNSMVMADHIINYSSQAKEAGLLLHTTVTIGYDVPWPMVHELLMSAAMETEFLEDEPPPFVLQTSLDDNYVAYELNAYTREASGKQKIYSDLHANIQNAFQAAEVEILSPHYRANRDGNDLTIPEKIDVPANDAEKPG